MLYRLVSLISHCSGSGSVVGDCESDGTSENTPSSRSLTWLSCDTFTPFGLPEGRREENSEERTFVPYLEIQVVVFQEGETEGK